MKIEIEDLTRLSDSKFLDLQKLLWNEGGRRKEERYRISDKCPDCVEGYTGTEQDHYVCGRCGGTSRYKEIKKYK